MRLLIARCQVDYAGKLTAHLPMAERLIMVKADGSISIHADGGAYKPLNWMTPPCTLRVSEPPAGLAATIGSDDDLLEVWEVSNKDGDTLQIAISGVLHDSHHELGVDPGLQKDGVEAHLQVLLAEHPEVFGDAWRLVQREYYTPIGPVDLLFRDDAGALVAVEVKRRGEVDGVEQLTRYLDLMNADPQLSPVRGVFAAQLIKPQAKVLAATRGIDCLAVDYDALRGMDDSADRLF
ncbi:endonuclease NucS [Propionicicella superfundia]|uniref:endonuclease NucS n=1 Tax=Propionicicella superfundia TaxID=348582 RepID=UPI00048C61B4|nr:endonuclease NucS [Propionicicella superfundia]